MPYVSELLGNKVYDSSDSIVGKLEDIVISPKNGAFSPLEFLVIKTLPGKQFKFVPYDAVENFTSSEISLKNLFSKIASDQLPSHQFIYLKKDVLDQQIVDVGGTRVVRVNDLRIGNFENRTSVLGLDASFRGLLRRLGWIGSFLKPIFRVNLIDWRQAQLLEKSGTLQLNTMADHLSELHPADLANIVEDLDVKSGSKLLAALDATEAAKVLEEIDPELQSILVKYLGPEQASKILAKMSSDEMADLIKTFSSKEAKTFLSTVGGRAQSIEKLIAYPDNTAGGLMTLEFLTARPDWTVGQTIEEVKKFSDTFRSITYVYVTGEEGKLLGVVSLRSLLVSAQNIPIKELAKTITAASALHPDDKIRDVIELMTRYNLYTAAVVDESKKLLGIVSIDDVMRQLYPAA